MGIVDAWEDILVCPKCRGSVVRKDIGLACYRCNLIYPIREEIPIMLIDSAIPMENENENKF